jgi:endonuclease I
MTNTKLCCLLLAFTMAASNAQAQGPNNSGTYYMNANGKKGAQLKTALFNIIKSPSVTSYDGLISAYQQTDTRPDGYVRDWYSNSTNYRHGSDTGSYKKEGDSYNREHSVPQSWFSKASPMKSDIVHVVPTDGYVNNRRSSYPFGEVGNVTYQSNNGYSKLGSSKTAGYSGTVFEPNDEIKGDIARIYFYMVTCYEDRCTGWSGGIFTSSKYPGLIKWTLDMMMRWSKLDPVDERETARNNAVFAVQSNRNPYVDYPGLEDYVWGTKVEQPFSYDSYEGGGGGIPVVTTVEQPVFSPNGGTFTDWVEVTITSATPGATIYYTTNNADATDQGNVYSGPITLTDNTTLKAIAVKDGVSSYQTMAEFIINESGQTGQEATAGFIALNSSFFNCNYSGSISQNSTEDLVGTKDGITVVYALGENGVNRYCNSEQIRLYKYNKLTISCSAGELTELEFQLAKETSKKLFASTGTVSDLTWRGQAQSVTFNVDEGSGNMQLSGVKVKTTATAGVKAVRAAKEHGVLRLLTGQKAVSPRKSGIYILNGKKVMKR